MNDQARLRSLVENFAEKSIVRRSVHGLSRLNIHWMFG